LSKDPRTKAQSVQDKEMTLKGILISGTGGSKRSDGVKSVMEGGAAFEDADGISGVNVATDGNISTPRLASAGNFWNGR